MLTISLILIACGYLFAYSLCRAAAAGDDHERYAEARKRLIEQQVERRYWNHRYVSRHWPGR